MDPSDSDSSEDDRKSYTETSVLLGYASQDPTGDKNNQLGGYPIWLDESNPPPGKLAKCKVCNDAMSLLIQLNGDLPERFPDHERRLYLFCCRRRACGRRDGSVRGLRGVRVSRRQDASSNEAIRSDSRDRKDAGAVKSTLGESLFGVKPSTQSSGLSNPFSTPASHLPTSGLFGNSKGADGYLNSTAEPRAAGSDASSLPSTFASKVRLSSPEVQQSTPVSHEQESWPPQSSFPAPFRQSSLDADYETLDKPSKKVIQAQAHLRDDLNDSNATAADGQDKEVFESTLDKTFQKFADRLSQNPEQVLRYEFGGTPLLYSRTDAVGRMLVPHQKSISSKVGDVRSIGSRATGMPKCANCGAKTVFELQLTPHAIEELEGDEVGLDGMEWGTIMLGVCSADCSPAGAEGKVGYVEQWVGVQWEEVGKQGA